MKNSSDTIRNRTRDLRTCSAVPQPTAPPLREVLRNSAVRQHGAQTISGASNVALKPVAAVGVSILSLSVLCLTFT